MSVAPIPVRHPAPSRFRGRSFARVVVALLVVAAPRPAAAQDTTRARPASRTITLQQAIAIALAQSLTVRAAENTARLDSLDVRSARSQFFPSLSASSGASQRILSGSGGRNTFGADASLSGGVTLFNGGQNVNVLRQARQNVEATTLDVARTRQAIVFTVATDYLDLITQQEQVRVQQENLTAQEQELGQLQEFVRQGTRPIGDVYQQQASVASTRLALVTARRGAEVAAVNLIQELVLDPRVDWVFETPRPDSTPAPAPAFRLDSLVDVAMRRRVDIQAQRYRVNAAETQIAIARGTRLPTVTGSAGFSSEYASGSDVGFLRQLDARRGGSVGVGVSVPLFDRGASSIAQQRARVQLENELLALRDEEQAVALEVRRAYLDYVAAREQLAAATAQQEAAALALQAAQARYRVGAATFVEVTLARATLIQAQSAVVSVRSAVAFQQALMSYYPGVLDPSNVSIAR
jgi:outer membrane protein